MRVAFYPDEPPGDPGTTAGGVSERTYNIRACEAAVKRFNAGGWPTRFRPELGIEAAIADAIRWGAELAIVIANNASSDPNARGSMFLFCTPEAPGLDHQGVIADAIGAAAVRAGLITRFTHYIEPVAWCCQFPKATVFWEVEYQTNAKDRSIEEAADFGQRVAAVLASALAVPPPPPPKPPAGPPPPPPPPPPAPEPPAQAPSSPVGQDQLPTPPPPGWQPPASPVPPLDSGESLPEELGELAQQVLAILEGRAAP